LDDIIEVSEDEVIPGRVLRRSVSHGPLITEPPPEERTRKKERQKSIFSRDHKRIKVASRPKKIKTL